MTWNLKKACFSRQKNHNAFRILNLYLFSVPVLIVPLKIERLRLSVDLVLAQLCGRVHFRLFSSVVAVFPRRVCQSGNALRSSLGS